ncbi:hypothetical protein SAY86_012180 [Trapa natans]|uniref:Uncharacterized protein n=1 Tax=Trapa natans TaxID=22666 RepID=A0AAN7LWD1_TRANT|nr:hypothetical protein SAY86_012180 [Trapa natans]
MKSMSEISGGSNNWLGFSLSQNMKIEDATLPSAPVSPSPAVPTGYALSPSFLSPHSSMCSFGGHSLSTDHSRISGSGFQYPVMPLKSDGSLCIMEAFSRSHPQASPKLEDFLTIGGTHNPQHQHSYGDGERETMPLSLDNIYYHPMGDLGGVGGLCLRNWVAGGGGGGSGGGREDYEQTIGNNDGVPASVVMGCGGGELLQSLSLSMSPGSQSSCVTTAPSNQHISASNEIVTVDTGKKRGLERGGQKPTVHRKSIDTFGQRTSQYRGVTRLQFSSCIHRRSIIRSFVIPFCLDCAAGELPAGVGRNEEHEPPRVRCSSPKDLVGTEPVNMGHLSDQHEPAGGPHFSNPSSLASSREGSPERMGPGPGFGKQPLGWKLIDHPPGPIGSTWIPAAVPVSLPNYPVFKAWGNV